MKAAVLGLPISHSLSPALHRAAYAALGLGDWSYQGIECDEAGLPALLAGLGPGWAGLSLTMPLKRAVLPLLDRADPVATQTGAANTVVFAGQARHGYNTDVAGLVTALTEAKAGHVRGAGQARAPGEAGGALILGAGATACSALAALRELGQREVAVAVRDPARAQSLLATAARLGSRVELRPFGTLDDGLDLLLSTVPAGAADSYHERLRQADHPPATVLDVVYHPWPTPLAVAARAVGAVTIGGFEFLLHQAARQVELMTGRQPPVAAMRAGGLAELARRPGNRARVSPARSRPGPR
jgi:shikimate dehydrogenase